MANHGYPETRIRRIGAADSNPERAVAVVRRIRRSVQDLGTAFLCGLARRRGL